MVLFSFMTTNLHWAPPWSQFIHSPTLLKYYFILSTLLGLLCPPCSSKSAENLAFYFAETTKAIKIDSLEVSPPCSWGHVHFLPFLTMDSLSQVAVEGQLRHRALEPGLLVYPRTLFQQSAPLASASASLPCPLSNSPQYTNVLCSSKNKTKNLLCPSH